MQNTTKQCLIFIMSLLICVEMLRNNRVDVHPADSSMAGIIYVKEWLRGWQIKQITTFKKANVIVGSHI